MFVAVMRIAIAATVLAVVTGSPSPAATQGGGFGPEIVVATAGEAEGFGTPFIARLADGGYIVTWNADRDGVRLRLDGRRLDRAGRPAGSTGVLVGPLSYFSAVDVAADGTGGFAALASWFPINIPGTASVIVGAFDADLQARTRWWLPVGDELGRLAMSIAGDLGGGFVAAYREYDSRTAVLAQRLRDDGSPAGTEVQVADGDGTRRRRSAAVAVDGLGEFVVVWDDTQSAFHPGPGVAARGFDAAGNAEGDGFAVSETGDEATEGFDQREVAAAMSADGRFAVTWVRGIGERGFYFDQCADVDTTIMLRRFDAGLLALGPERAVSTNGCNDAPRVDAADETVAVAWRAAARACEPASPECTDILEIIRAEPGGDVSARTPLRRRGPDVAASPDGSFIVVWVEARPEGDVLLARRYVPDMPVAPVCGHATGAVPEAASTTSHQAGTAARGLGDPPLGDTGAAAAVPTASDALAALLAAIELRACAPCVCDTDDSGVVAASDALRILQVAAGLPAPLACPACT